jgi:N-acyl-D-aspartate/D-glutamate deacylase
VEFRKHRGDPYCREDGTTMFDYAITGGTIVDGTGTPGFRADIGIKDGRIVEVGSLDGDAARTLAADGLVVTPGFVDPHTHYDAQLFWDGLATPSSWHGVTTVIGGNCGFTLAPLKDQDADYTRRMMAQVEGMPLSGLEQGVPWSWESFGEYLDALDGRIAVNAGFLVGHCALRRYVLGDEFARESTDDEREQLAALLRESLAAGGLGLSTTRSTTHTDGDGGPVPSRFASEAELAELCGVVGEYDGMSLELITTGCIEWFSDDEVDYIASLSVAARSPLNWNVLAVSTHERDRVGHQLRPSQRARQLGGRVVALTMPVAMDMNVNFLTFSVLWHIPGWRAVLDVDVPERIRRLQDPSIRAELMASAQTSRFARLADFSHYTIGDVFSAENERFRNRVVGDLAAERGQDSFATVVDIAVADGLQTTLWPGATADSDADWALRAEVWANPDVLLGGSDAGAHLDRMLGAPYPTRFLADSLRGRKLVSLERAVQMMTDVPARLFGLRGRGRLSAGYQADIVVFDPERIGSGPAHLEFDLPGGNKRLVAGATGVEQVLVNGRDVITDGSPTGHLPGTVLRSGRDTANAAR